ncbi:MAG: IPTL-CTERM sorting domain-containing protein [Deltaproteobacteria bacterium]|nr:IPTL-CTERM sorting domain-containing protein [Deltaproteobacteria bacterium]MBW1817405.1 IPTL-CTERM sorting domain-containing protein [Deltaproteobacteria bacterium]
MNPIVKSTMQLGVIYMICFGLFNLQPAAAEGNIDGTFKYACSENCGWVNFSPTNGGVTVHNTHLSGYAWAANIGWIKLGYGPGPYKNNAADNWGVNRDRGTNALSGFAWSENAGWINFNPTNSKVTIDPRTGKFDGYAWGENLGWIHFKSPVGLYGVVTTNTLPVPTLNPWGMTGLMLLLGIFAVRLMRRGRKNAIRTI